jgi:hypothetical protein
MSNTTGLLTMEPGHLIRETADRITAAPEWVRRNMIEYCRNYVEVYYGDLQVPATITERIDRLEEKWLSRE